MHGTFFFGRDILKNRFQIDHFGNNIKLNWIAINCMYNQSLANIYREFHLIFLTRFLSYSNRLEIREIQLECPVYVLWVITLMSIRNPPSCVLTRFYFWKDFFLKAAACVTFSISASIKFRAGNLGLYFLLFSPKKFFFLLMTW